MEHFFLRFGGRPVLLADVHRGSEGKGVGYGMTLIRLRRALLVAQTQGAQVLIVRPRRALNAAVTELQGVGVEIIPPGTWKARWLNGVWLASAPFRVGKPWLWMQRALARVALGRAYGVVERSSWIPRRLRAAVMRQRPAIRRLKAVNRAYAACVEDSWKAIYRSTMATRQELERSGRGMPPITLRLPAGREREAAQAAERLGISPGRALVTLHVRESGYRPGAGLSQRSWDDVRNARIDTFAPAMSALVDRGYTVVRLGDASMTPVNLRGVVDLATAAARTDWLEVWCTARSEFLVGCDSGPSWLAVLLGVPVLTVNAVHFRDMSRPFDRIVCKLARDRDTGRMLSISEMLTPEFLRTGFKGGRYECVDNAPSDIRRAVLDMIEVVHGRERRSSWQARFNRRLREIDRRSLRARSALEGVAIGGAASLGTLSQGFAKKYFVRQETEPATALIEGSL